MSVLRGDLESQLKGVRSVETEQQLTLDLHFTEVSFKAGELTVRLLSFLSGYSISYDRRLAYL